MKTININDYQKHMGKLIILDDNNDINYGTKISYDYLLFHYKELLNKNDSYYIMCNKGQKSKRIVSILELYGYNVTNVIK